MAKETQNSGAGANTPSAQALEASAPEVKLTKMRRDTPSHPGGPTSADVHPEEVQNYMAGGWLLDTTQEPKK